MKKQNKRWLCLSLLVIIFNSCGFGCSQAQVITDRPATIQTAEPPDAMEQNIAFCETAMEQIQCYNPIDPCWQKLPPDLQDFCFEIMDQIQDHWSDQLMLAP